MHFRQKNIKPSTKLLLLGVALLLVVLITVNILLKNFLVG